MAEKVKVYLVRKYRTSFLSAVKASRLTTTRIYRDLDFHDYDGLYPMADEWADKKDFVFGPVTVATAKLLVEEWDSSHRLAGDLVMKLTEARDAKCAAIIAQEKQDEAVESSLPHPCGLDDSAGGES